MQPLNAIDAITPAFTRTHQTLFQPFQLGRSWKLAATQYLGFCGNLFLPVPLFALFVPAGLVPRSAIALALLIPTVIMLVVLYFCGRLELVSFEMLVTRNKFVAPMWSRYSARVWPWIGTKIVVGTVAALLALALIAAPLRHTLQQVMPALHSMPSFSPGEKPDQQAIQAAMLPLVAAINQLQLLSFVFFFILKVPFTLLHDFVMPFYILEEITLLAAIRRGLDVFLADPLQVVLYLILKPILFVLGYIIQYIATLIVCVPILIVVALLAVLMHHATALLALVVVLAIAFLFWVVLFSFGYMLALLNAYGIYFLGGRYPLLGEMLEPSPFRPFTPPPVFPSKDEQDDSSNEPPMPMDPAVA